MLGKLFSRAPAPPLSGTTNTSLPQSTRNPESVQEDLHTRNLLFPDAQALYQHRHDQVFPLAATPSLPTSSTSNAFDYEGDIELEERDVRVLIMQGATPSGQTPFLLYDSHALATPAERYPPLDPRRNPTSPRKSSLSHSRPVTIQQDMPTPRQGTFERRASVHSRYSHGESEGQKAFREYWEEIGTFSSCIFANSEIMAYRGTSTKVHVVPTEARPSEFPASSFGDGRGSIGRSSARSSRLAQSFTSEILSPTNPSFSVSTPRLVERRKVLVTRLFPVHIATDDTPASSTRGQEPEDTSGFPFPNAEDEPAVNLKPKMKRTPMYAIALVIQLPRPPPPTAFRSGLRVSSSYTEQDSFPSSFSSTRRSGWTMIGGNGFGHESFESSYGTEMEDQLDAITQHWDTIMRTLTRLQSVVTTMLSPMLKQFDIPPPELGMNLALHQTQSARHPVFDSRQGQPKVNIRYIVLPADCLKGNRHVIVEVDGAKARIVSGLRATRVVTGQGRWGIWREEARTVAKMLGGRDQHFFFYTLMTGFLSTHTDWLQALSPLLYRKRYLQQQKSKGEEDMSLPARTIIVAQDKIVARRLVFLLSAFLPANQQLPALRAHRPSTSASASQSPPSGVVTIVREESLRRKITGNRRVGPRQHSRQVSTQSQTTRPPQGIPPPLAHLAFEGHHERRSSELNLMRQPSATTSERKSSAATTATVTPETTVPHFSTVHRRTDSRPNLRPGSSESVAADDLKRSLTRCDSTGQVNMISGDSRSQSSRWGSVISGLWSPRRRDSTSSTLQTPTSANSPMSPAMARHQGYQGNKPADTVQESERMEARDVFPEADSPRTPRQLAPPPRVESGLETRPVGGFESPVKTSINAADGVIDVDVPFPDYLTAFETAVSSPSSSGYLSTPYFNSGLEAFEHSCRTGLEGDMPFNVGGWLQEFHPDFTLQAIPPQPDLMSHVKDALRAEPTPMTLSSVESDHPIADRWVDVSTALVADSTNFSIVRVRYKRLVRPKLSDTPQNPRHTSLNPSVPPYETQLEEKFIEEPIFTLEAAFTDAIEKVISQSVATAPNSSPKPSVAVSGSNGSLGNGSASSSRSTSKVRDRLGIAPVSEEVDIPESALPLSLAPKLPPVPTEVPRSKCRTVVLSSLEELVLDVVEQRKRESRQEGQEGQEGQRTVPINHERESILRETVRGWLDAIDLGGQT